MKFRWNTWNLEHIADHGVRPQEVEGLIREARGSFLKRIGEDKWQVLGCGQGGRFLQVIYVLDEDDAVFVIHARLLTQREKRRFRRRRRR